jgi:chromosome segregation ATPase
LALDEKLNTYQNNSKQTITATLLREEDIDKIKSRHREEMKLLSAENDDLHQRTKQLQSDLQLHKESLDVTIRYKIDLEKAMEEKSLLQRELDRLKHEKDSIEHDRLDSKAKYDSLQEEIRVLLSDRSKIEQKLTDQLQEQIKQRQRCTDDVKKFRTQIEQLNVKLGDAEARLLVAQTQNEALLISKDRDMKIELKTLTQRLSTIESEKINAEQRYRNENREIANKQQRSVHDTLIAVTPMEAASADQLHQYLP